MTGDMPKVRREWLDVFSEGWHSVPEGEPGDRRRAGLEAVIPLILAEERHNHPGLFDVSVGTCGHIWRRGSAVLDGCPVCLDIAQQREQARREERERHDRDCPPPGAIRREERDAIAAVVENLPDAHRKKSKMGGKGFGKWGGDGSIWRLDVLNLLREKK